MARNRLFEDDVIVIGMGRFGVLHSFNSDG